MGKYDDIMGLPRPASKFPAMPVRDRAAQFSPFAALNGHEDAINETARRVDSKTELSDEDKALLDRKTQLISEHPDSELEITYFIPDKRKNGGSYITVSGSIKRIDAAERTIIMKNGELIPLDDVLDMKSQLFDRLGITE